MAGLAVEAELTAMRILVAVGTRRGDEGEDEILMAADAVETRVALFERATDVPMLGSISRIETVGEMESGRRRERMVRGALILLFLLAAGAVFLHLNYDAEMSSLVGDALKFVK